MMSARESEAMAKDGDVDRWSSGSEEDDVPITEILKSKADKVGLVIPEGELAVGPGIARDFGKDLDGEDFDVEEYKYEYELRQAVDNGKTLPEDTRTKRTRWSRGGRRGCIRR